MSQTAQDLKKEIDKSLELMRTLRDEVRVKLHLAGMDAKEEWRKLEPRLDEVERAAAAATEATKGALADAVKAVTKLREKLASH